VAPLIADLEASRKASGFLSHAATMFCSFCLCKQEDLKILTLAQPPTQPSLQGLQKNELSMSTFQIDRIKVYAY